MAAAETRATIIWWKCPLSWPASIRNLPVCDAGNGFLARQPGDGPETM